MSTDSTKWPAQPDPDGQGRLYPQHVVPYPPVPAHDQPSNVAELVRYHLARAQGFWTAMLSEPVEQRTTNAWSDFYAIGVNELYVALLLAELEKGTPLAVALTNVRGWLEDGGAAGEWLHEHGTRHGLDLATIRPYLTRDALEERRAREKHPHRIVVTLDRGGYPRFEVDCDADATAFCHQQCTDPDGYCEVYDDIKQGPDGTWTHEATDLDDDDNESTVRHVMHGAVDCSWALWLNEDTSLLPELYDGPGAPLRSDRIEVSWDEDHYTWRYAGEPKVARS